MRTSSKASPFELETKAAIYLILCNPCIPSRCSRFVSKLALFVLIIPRWWKGGMKGMKQMKSIKRPIFILHRKPGSGTGRSKGVRRGYQISATPRDFFWHNCLGRHRVSVIMMWTLHFNVRPFLDAITPAPPHRIRMLPAVRTR